MTYDRLLSNVVIVHPCGCLKGLKGDSSPNNEICRHLPSLMTYHLCDVFFFFRGTQKIFPSTVFSVEASVVLRQKKKTFKISLTVIQ